MEFFRLWLAAAIVVALSTTHLPCTFASTILSNSYCSSLVTTTGIPVKDTVGKAYFRAMAVLSCPAGQFGFATCEYISLNSGEWRGDCEDGLDPRPCDANLETSLIRFSTTTVKCAQRYYHERFSNDWIFTFGYSQFPGSECSSRGYSLLQVNDFVLNPDPCRSATRDNQRRCFLLSFFYHGLRWAYYVVQSPHTSQNVKTMLYNWMNRPPTVPSNYIVVCRGRCMIDSTGKVATVYGNGQYSCVASYLPSSPYESLKCKNGHWTGTCQHCPIRPTSGSRVESYTSPHSYKCRRCYERSGQKSQLFCKNGYIYGDDCDYKLPCPCNATVTNGVVTTSNGSVTCNIGYRHLPSTQAVFCDSNRQLHNVGTCEKIPGYCKFPIDELKKVAQITFTQMTIGYIDLPCQPWTYANGRMRMWCDGDTRTSGRYTLEKGKCIPAGCSSLPISAYTCFEDQYWDPYLNMHVPVTVEKGRTQGCYAKCPRGMRGSIQCIGRITDGWVGWAGNCEHDPTPCDPTDGSKFWLSVGHFNHECVKTSIKVSNTEWWYAYPYQLIYNRVCEERHQGRLSAKVFSHITNTTLLDFLRPFTNSYSIYLQPTQSHPSSSSNPSKPSSIPICVASCKSNSLGPELANIYADGRYSCRSGVPLERSPRAICRKGVFRGDCIVAPSCSTINKQSITNLKSIYQTGRYQCDRGYGQFHVDRVSTCTSDGTSDGACLKMKAYGKRILAYRLAHPHARLI